MPQRIDVRHDAVVAKALNNERRVVLNKGSNDGIQKGDDFIVFGSGNEIVDPSTGISLGILEEIKGKGRVIHVQEKMCTIETYEYDNEIVSNSLGVYSFFGPRKVRVYRDFEDIEVGDLARKIRYKTSPKQLATVAATTTQED